MELSPAAIDRLAALLEARTGQQLAPSRRWRVDAALGPTMAAHGIDDPAMLIARIEQGDAALADAVVFALLNHETFFFRDRAAFDQLIDRALPELASRQLHSRRLRIWSAGCSTGQEPYSLALAFARDTARWAGWTIDIVATDISPVAIARAKAGVYSQFEAQRGLSIHSMLEMFERDGDAWRVADPLRRTIRFREHSLLDPPPCGPFDLVLCRNVLLYFTPERRRAVLARIAERMAEGGLLMLGAGETVLGQTDAFVVDPELRGLYRAHAPGDRVMAQVA